MIQFSRGVRQINSFAHVRNKVTRERDEATLPLDHLDGSVTLIARISDVCPVAPDVAQDLVRLLPRACRVGW
jgi:hypothetical protein